MKRIITTAVIILALLLVPFATACGGTTEATGDVVFAITDAAADMSAVTKVEVTVDRIRVHAEGGAWTTVSSEERTFDLLQLREMTAAQLMVQTRLQARNYNMVELSISKVLITDGSGTHEANLINNSLQMEFTLEVQAGSTTTAVFDFIADESLYETTDSRYVFAPVIALQTRTQAQVQVRNNNEVEISGGNMRTNARIGMNVDGEMGVGLQIQAGVQLQISAGRVIQIGGGGGGNGQGNGQTGGQVTVSGTIRAVNPAQNTITIQISPGQDVVVSIASETEISIGSAVSTLVTLAARAGSNVEVTYNAATNIASEITVQ